MPLPQFWNLHYEVFLSRLGPLQRVQEAGEVHWGRPYLLGTHLSLEPVRGWTVSATRMVQFGGDGQRVTPGRLWQAFFKPVQADNLGSFGNQQMALASRMNACWASSAELKEACLTWPPLPMRPHSLTRENSPNRLGSIAST